MSTAVDASARARVLGIKTQFQNLRAGSVAFLPQHVGIVGQGNTVAVYATTKRQVTSAGEVAELYGYGSPLHLAARQLFPQNGDGVGSIPVTVFPLDDDGSGVASAGDVTPGGSPTVAASYIVRINNIDSEAFVISVGDTVADIITAMTAAVNAVLEMPVIAEDATPGTSTEMGLESKWAGTSANDIYVEVVGSTTAGNTFAITQPVGGLVNPDVQDALDQVGDVWISMMLNCMDIADTTTLGLYDTFGEGRWGALTRKPLVVFSGNLATTLSAATAVSDARPLDRTNGQLVAPGSVDLPFVTAARELARIVVMANSIPSHDYGSQKADGLVPGTDGEQWDYATKDAALKAGSSTIDVKDGVVYLSDTVTFYNKTSEQPDPAYRYVVDIVKIQQILYNLNLEFATAKWDGAALIPDDQPTVEPTAKQPKMAKAAIAAIIDSLALNALISDPETAKASIVAEIDSANPKRLNVTFTVQLSGNTNIISIDLNFGFFFGTPALVA